MSTITCVQEKGRTMAHRFIPRSCAIRSFLASFVVVGLAACGSGSDSTAKYKIQATVTGLTDGNSVALQATDGSKPTTVSQNGPVDLLYAPAGGKYHVTVKTAPASPPETCTISHGEGTIGTSDVTDVLVTCSEKTFNISVSVSGLEGSGLAICENYTDGTCASAVPITKNDTIVIRSSLADRFAYLLVFAGGQPTNPWQTCSFTSGSSDGTKAGGIIQGADVTVTVACTTRSYAIAGTITGLTGTGLKLSMAGQDDVTPLAGEKSFGFAKHVDSGSDYEISVTGLPTNPPELCTVSAGVGKIAGSDVTGVSVTCVEKTFSIAVLVKGLLGSGLAICDEQVDPNCAAPVTIAANDTTTVIRSTVAYKSPFILAFSSNGQPVNPRQSCSFSDGSADGTRAAGIVQDADVTLYVKCISNFIGGTIAGLAGNGLTLSAAGQIAKPLAGATTFVFPKEIDSGTSYTISMTALPTAPWQTCAIANESGFVNDANAGFPAITCTTNSYLISGTISGYMGSSMVLRATNQQDQSYQDSTILANATSFQIPKALSGSAYVVTVHKQPTNPPQFCSITNGAVTPTNTDVSGVQVSCQSPGTDLVTIGGDMENVTSKVWDFWGTGTSSLREDFVGRSGFDGACLALSGGAWSGGHPWDYQVGYTSNYSAVHWPVDHTKSYRVIFTASVSTAGKIGIALQDDSYNWRYSDSFDLSTTPTIYDTGQVTVNEDGNVGLIFNLGAQAAAGQTFFLDDVHVYQR